MKKLSFITLFLLLFFQVRSQSGGFVIDSLATTILPAQVNPNQGSKIYYTLVFSYEGNDTFPGGEISMFRRIVGQTDSVLLQTDTFGTFAPNTLITMTDSESVDTMAVEGGTNALIIWPMSIHVNTTEYSQPIIIFIEPVGRAADTKTSRLTVYPNPTSSLISLKTNDQSNSIQSVTLFDYTGRIIKKKTTHVSQLEVNDVPSGSYFLEINFENDHKEVRKIHISR